MGLLDSKPKQGKPKHWIQGAVKHPGALTAAAQRNGRSKLQEAQAESKSGDPKVRGRGLLGMRFLGKHGGI